MDIFLSPSDDRWETEKNSERGMDGIENAFVSSTTSNSGKSKNREIRLDGDYNYRWGTENDVSALQSSGSKHSDNTHKSFYYCTEKYISQHFGPFSSSPRQDVPNKPTEFFNFF